MKTQDPPTMSAKPITVEVSKSFNVPVDRLYRAWITGENLQAWWHPFNKNLGEVINEVRKDGSIKFCFEGEDKCIVSGAYSEVEENKRLVYTWNWDLIHNEMQNSNFVLTIDFSEEGQGSRISITQSGFADELSTELHKKGWARGLDSLKVHLEG